MKLKHATIALVLWLSWCAPAAAQSISTGQFESGAYYHIQVPVGWESANGLVIWNHGFDLNPPEPVPSLGPLAQLQLSEGYAVAATSYSLNGWALFQTIGDLRDLVHQFEREFGVPEKIYLSGGSMGGLVSVQALEAANLGNVVGVYSLCGALGGARLWDAALDIRLAYDAVCADVPGADIDGGAAGLPIRIDPELYGDSDPASALALFLGDRINACTGVFEASSARSEAQQQRLNRLMAVLDLPNEAFFVTVMGFATAGLADLVYDPAKLDGEIGPSNIGVDYDDVALNRHIARVNATDLDRLALLSNYAPTGNTGDARVLAIHTDEDGLVPVESLQAYAGVAPEDSYAFAVVDEETPSHCGFNQAEGVAGWRALTHWVAKGDQAVKPDAARLQNNCEQAMDLGADGPCRYAPGVEVAALDAVIPPRDVPAFEINGDIFGAWYNRDQPGEGWVIEPQGNGTALVYWISYPPHGAPGSQRWLIGTGEITGNSFTATLSVPTGHPFGVAAPVGLDVWGEITFTFAGETKGLVRWTGPPAYGTGHEKIVRLTEIGPFPLDIDPIPPALGASGSWYDLDWPGEGWHFTRLGEKALVYWFTFDSEGEPAWLMGVGEVTGGTIEVDEVYITRGAHFGDAFNPRDVKPEPWGSMRFEFQNCHSGRMQFDSSLAAFGSGERQLMRLTIAPVSFCN